MKEQILELFRFRELVRNLVLRDLNVRYKGTTLGFFWSLATPLLMVGVFYVLYTRVIPIGLPQTRYALFLLCGVFPWSFVSIALGDATLSVVSNAGLVRRAYFPREALPLSPILSGLLHLSGTFSLLLAILAWQELWSWALLALPMLMLLNGLMLYGIGLLTSCAHAFFRDVHWIVGAVMGLWFYASPVFYSSDMVRDSAHISQRLKPFYELNPMVGILDAYRRVLLEGRLPTAAQLAVPVGATAIALIAGLSAYRSHAYKFAEEV